MPQVPYTPYPTTQPTSPGERISVQTPGAVFGENVAAALQHLGTTTEHVGDELFNRAVAMQQLNNESEARDLQTQHAQQTAPIVADFDSLKGRDPRDALQSHLKRLQDVRDSLASSASNPAVRRLFLNDSAGFMQRETFSAARHAGDEFKNYVVGSAQARSDMVQHTWTDPEDQREVDEKVATHDSDGATIAGAQGWGKDQLDDWKFKQTSQTYAGQLNALALRGNTEKAFDLLEKYNSEGKLTQEHYEAMQKVLWKRNEALGADFLAKKIDKDMPTASPQQKLDKLSELAPKYDHGDPDFLNAAEHKLRTVMHLDNVLQQQNQHSNMQTIFGLIRKGEVDSLSKLTATPEGKAAYDALDEKTKNSIPKIIAQAVLARDYETNLETMKALTGMAHDPTQRQAFLNVDPFDPRYKLGLKDIDKVLAMRKTLIHTPLDDPLVRQGWSAMRQQLGEQLRDLGVISRSTGKEKPEQANLLRGGMAIALQEFMDSNKRPPSPEEFIEKIAKPLIKTHAEPIWFGIRSRDVPQYATAVDKKTIENARKELSAAAEKQGIEPPTDSEIHSYIAHQQWKEHFQGSGGRTDEGGPKGKPGGGPNIPD